MQNLKFKSKAIQIVKSGKGRILFQNSQKNLFFGYTSNNSWSDFRRVNIMYI